jgi:hypothetical protein
LAILLIASFFAGTLATSNQSVDAQGINPLDLAAPDAIVTRACTFGGVGTYTEPQEVVLLYCTDAPAAFFGYPTDVAADARIANRYLATVFAAVALSKPLAITYDDDATHNPPGCPAATCRRLTAVGFLP